MVSKVALLAAFAAGAPGSASQAKKVVGYYEDWSPMPSRDVLSHYTHIVYAFLETSDDSCGLSRPDESKINAFKSAGCKVLGSLGGASMNKYWSKCPVDRLVSHVKSIVDKSGLDGVDIDYEVDPPKQDFVVQLHRGLRSALAGKLLTHVPENNLMVSGGSYWNIIKQVPDVDFVMIQYYNDYPEPISDLQGTVKHYAAVVNDIFKGDATKVVFGMCVSECSKWNVRPNQAGAFVSEMMKHFPNNFGGAMVWAINSGDLDGSWSNAVKKAMGGSPSPSPSPSPCTWIGHCKGDPCQTYNDCDGQLICSGGKCEPATNASSSVLV